MSRRRFSFLPGFRCSTRRADSLLSPLLSPPSSFFLIPFPPHVLYPAGLLGVDHRQRERKKTGQPKARKNETVCSPFLCSSRSSPFLTSFLLPTDDPSPFFVRNSQWVKR